MAGRRFRDRHDAGIVLGRHLGRYAGEAGLLVLALPRGGVPVGAEVAAALGAPLDVVVVRKLGVPGHEELAFGAVASGGPVVLNDDVVAELGIGDATIAEVLRAEQAELARRERAYRDDRPLPEVAGRTVVLVDDGLATGATMAAAVAALRRRGPRSIVVAVPVAAAETVAAFRGTVDDVVCVATPDPFYAVGVWYRDFSETTDDEVRGLLARASTPARSP